MNRPNYPDLSRQIDQLRQKWEHGELSTREYHESIERAKRSIALDNFVHL